MDINLETCIALGLFEAKDKGRFAKGAVAGGAAGATAGALGYNEAGRLYHGFKGMKAEEKGDLGGTLRHGARALAHDQASPWRRKIADEIASDLGV